jgi:hypothetical protein
MFYNPPTQFRREKTVNKYLACLMVVLSFTVGASAADKTAPDLTKLQCVQSVASNANQSTMIVEAGTMDAGTERIILEPVQNYPECIPPQCPLPGPDGKPRHGECQKVCDPNAGPYCVPVCKCRCVPD